MGFIWNELFLYIYFFVKNEIVYRSFFQKVRVSNGLVLTLAISLLTVIVHRLLIDSFNQQRVTTPYWTPGFYSFTLVFVFIDLFSSIIAIFLVWYESVKPTIKRHWRPLYYELGRLGLLLATMELIRVFL